MKKFSLCLILILYALTYQFNSFAHKNIIAWRNAAKKGKLATDGNIAAMKKMDRAVFKAQMDEIKASSTDPNDNDNLRYKLLKRNIYGLGKVGIGTLFTGLASFCIFRVIPESLKLQDEQARVSATFWGVIGATISGGVACFFNYKAFKNISNNTSKNKIKQRIEENNEALEDVEKLFGEQTHEEDNLQ